MLKLENISKTFYPGTVNEKLALDRVSLDLAPGDFATIIGSNGAGKSTLFGAIAGDFLTDTGKIVLDGQDLTFLPAHRRAKAMGRLFQDPLRGTAPGMTIEENLTMAAGGGGWLTTPGKKQKEQLREVLSRLHMGLEDRMKQPVGLLSGGQRQALTLVMATLVPPKLLLLDEHTAALDPAAAEQILQLTKEIVAAHRITTLMVTHNMHSALELGNRLLMMDGGRIVLDLNAEQKQGMTVQDLLDAFHENAGKHLDNDRILLA